MSAPPVNESHLNALELLNREHFPLSTSQQSQFYFTGSTAMKNLLLLLSLAIIPGISIAKPIKYNCVVADRPAVCVKRIVRQLDTPIVRIQKNHRIQHRHRHNTVVVLVIAKSVTALSKSSAFPVSHSL